MLWTSKETLLDVFGVIASIFSELTGGGQISPPVPEDQKKLGLNRVKITTQYDTEPKLDFK